MMLCISCPKHLKLIKKNERRDVTVHRFNWRGVFNAKSYYTALVGTLDLNCSFWLVGSLVHKGPVWFSLFWTAAFG